MTKNNKPMQALLKAGDRVALIAPSSGQKPDEKHYIQEAMQWLESQGLSVKYSVAGNTDYLYLAASDTARLAAIENAFNDDEIVAVFCTRGGYGLSRIVDKINIREDITPKIVIGYSDVTALHLQLINHPKITCIHGPVLASKQLSCCHNLAPFLFSERLHNHSFSLDDIHLTDLNAKSKTLDYRSLLQDNTVKFTGGNLCLVACSLGSKHEIETAGKVLLLEEIGEPPYRVDRMLQQLKNAGKFDKVTAIIFGEMVACDSQQISLKEVLEDIFADADFPVAIGLPFGHGDHNDSWVYQ